MSQEQNRSPRGRSLNDVLLIPPRLAATTMNRHRAPRRSSTALSQFGNPMNLPRARRFPVPRNDLPSNRDDLFELVVQTTTSALTQNLRIEELVPILRQLRHRRTRDISNVLADVTQLLERDLLALVGLSEAITRIPTIPPVAPPTPTASSRRRTHRPIVLEDTDDEGTPCPARATLLRTGSCFECFAPGHIHINCRWYQCPMCHSSRLGHLSRLCPLRVTEELSEPSTPLMVRPPEDPPAAATATSDDSFIGSSPTTDVTPDKHLLIESNPRPSPQIPEENPDLDILIDKVLPEERPLSEYSDVYPIEIISPIPTQFAPATPSPLCEYLSYENTTPVFQSSVRSSPELESPPSTSLRARSSNYSDANSHSSSPVNDDAEDSARSF
ncbi:hypothetical protein BU15DRAFT_83297 [Melanogaster broomeanus]|nr:hypothetical protein BU15DRAFT_83297 [Melanogaster broomeanus]